MYKKITALALTAALLTGPALAAQPPQFLVPEGNYSDVYPYSEGYAVVTNNLTPGAAFPLLHYGLIDWDGKEVISPRWGKIGSFQWGMSLIEGKTYAADGTEDRYFGFMDHSFQTVIPTQYAQDSGPNLYEFRDGMAQVCGSQGQYHLLDRAGNIIHTCVGGLHPVNGVQIKDPFRAQFDTGGSEVQNYVGWVEYYQDPVTGEIKKPTEYPLPSVVSGVKGENGFHAKVSKPRSTTYRFYIPLPDGTSALLDLRDDPDFIYYGADVIDGMTLVCNSEAKIGIARLDGTLVIPCQFDRINRNWWSKLSISTLHNQKLAAVRDGQPVCFDITGKEYYPFLEQYQDVIVYECYEKDGYMVLEMADRDIYLDLEGNEIPESAAIATRNKDKALAQQWGLEEGWKIYDLANDYNSGLLRVYNPSKRLVSYYDLKGNMVLEPVEYLPPELPYDRSLDPSVGPFHQGRTWFHRPDGKWVYLLHPDWVSQDAALSPCKVTVDGKAVDFNAYLMKNNNYFKLRDLAMALKGTSAEFSIEYEASSGLTFLKSASTYAPVGGELSAGDGVPLKWAMPTHAGLYFNGVDPDLLGFTIDQNNYYKLRDVARLLNINVTWDQATGTVAIDTGTAYQR